MPLIASARHTAGDLAHWGRVSRADPVHAQLASFRRRVERARETVRAFAAAGRCYAGVSWGKDSTVLAHLVATEAPEVPLVWVRVEPIANPDCVLVRDAFLSRHDVVYDEIEVACRIDAEGEAHATGTIERGFRAAMLRHGDRYLSGVRGQESGTRALGLRRRGVMTGRTAQPLGWWSAADVWAYLAAHDLPIHPAYACSMGGLWERDRIRVASLGMRRGEGVGKLEWERAYYRRHSDSSHLRDSPEGGAG